MHIRQMMSDWVMHQITRTSPVTTLLILSSERLRTMTGPTLSPTKSGRSI